MYHCRHFDTIKIAAKFGLGMMEVIQVVQCSDKPQYRRLVAKFKKWASMPKERIDYYPKPSNYVAQNDLSFHEILKMEMGKL